MPAIRRSSAPSGTVALMTHLYSRPNAALERSPATNEATFSTEPCQMKSAQNGRTAIRKPISSIHARVLAPSLSRTISIRTCRSLKIREADREEHAGSKQMPFKFLERCGWNIIKLTSDDISQRGNNLQRKQNEACNVSKEDHASFHCVLASSDNRSGEISATL